MYWCIPVFKVRGNEQADIPATTEEYQYWRQLLKNTNQAIY
jgi:hypothetical protein